MEEESKSSRDSIASELKSARSYWRIMSAYLAPTFDPTGVEKTLADQYNAQDPNTPTRHIKEMGYTVGQRITDVASSFDDISKEGREAIEKEFRSIAKSRNERYVKSRDNDTTYNAIARQTTELLELVDSLESKSREVQLSEIEKVPIVTERMKQLGQHDTRVRDQNFVYASRKAHGYADFQSKQNGPDLKTIEDALNRTVTEYQAGCKHYLREYLSMVHDTVCIVDGKPIRLTASMIDQVDVVIDKVITYSIDGKQLHFTNKYGGKDSYPPFFCRTDFIDAADDAAKQDKMFALVALSNILWGTSTQYRLASIRNALRQSTTIEDFRSMDTYTNRSPQITLQSFQDFLSREEFRNTGESESLTESLDLSNRFMNRILVKVSSEYIDWQNAIGNKRISNERVDVYRGTSRYGSGNVSGSEYIQSQDPNNLGFLLGEVNQPLLELSMMGPEPKFIAQGAPIDVEAIGDTLQIPNIETVHQGGVAYRDYIRKSQLTTKVTITSNEMFRVLYDQTDGNQKYYLPLPVPPFAPISEVSMFPNHLIEDKDYVLRYEPSQGVYWIEFTDQNIALDEFQIRIGIDKMSKQREVPPLHTGVPLQIDKLHEVIEAAHEAGWDNLADAIQKVVPKKQRFRKPSTISSQQLEDVLSEVLEYTYGVATVENAQNVTRALQLGDITADFLSHINVDTGKFLVQCQQIARLYMMIIQYTADTQKGDVKITKGSLILGNEGDQTPGIRVFQSGHADVRLYAKNARGKAFRVIHDVEDHSPDLAESIHSIYENTYGEALETEAQRLIEDRVNRVPTSVAAREMKHDVYMHLFHGTSPAKIQEMSESIGLYKTPSELQDSLDKPAAIIVNILEWIQDKGESLFQADSDQRAEVEIALGLLSKIANIDNLQMRNVKDSDDKRMKEYLKTPVVYVTSVAQRMIIMIRKRLETSLSA